MRAFRRHLAGDESDGPSDARRLSDLLNGDERWIVINGDIDGLVSGCMLSSVTGWKIAAITWKGGVTTVHDELLAGSGQINDFQTAGQRLFTVDLSSPHIPGVANHPLLWGSKRLAGRREAADLAETFDARVRAAALARMIASPSLWIEVGGATDSLKDPKCIQYRYPLGTAQILLALLEASGNGPQIFDRDYIPWLIANCDDGVNSYTKYFWNAPMWWSAMAAGVGPSSYSEQLFNLVRNARPNQFLEVDRQMRHEEAALAIDSSGDEQTVAGALSADKWNLTPEGSTESLAVVAAWIDRLTGWGDPFLGGGECLDAWRQFTPASGTRLCSQSPSEFNSNEFQSDLECAFGSLSMGFSQFEDHVLFWTAPWWDET